MSNSKNEAFEEFIRDLALKSDPERLAKIIEKYTASGFTIDDIVDSRKFIEAISCGEYMIGISENPTYYNKSRISSGLTIRLDCDSISADDAEEFIAHISTTDNWYIESGNTGKVVIELEFNNVFAEK